MGDMQKKILGAIKERAEKAGLEFVQQENYANTGTVFLMVGFEAVLSFGYDFQPRTASLQFYPKGKKVVSTCGFTHEDCVLDAYLRYEDLFGKMQEVYRLVDSAGKAA